MNSLLGRLSELQQQKRKGFTLVELIVVIVIIAILIAALTPAILGVIDRANVSADEADARAIMMAGSVAALSNNPPSPPTTSAEIMAQLQGGNVSPNLRVTVHFSGSVATGATITTGGRTASSIGSVIGSSPTSLSVSVTGVGG